MSGFFDRILKIAKAESLNQLRKLGAKLFYESEYDDGYRYYDKEYGSDSNSYFSGKSERKTSGSATFDSGNRANGQEVPKQVREDLAIFNLKPPSSLEEVKKARNREIKKYHSDRFTHNPEKYQTSKEIMQIYNGAYERLRSYYEKGRQT